MAAAITINDSLKIDTSTTFIMAGTDLSLSGAVVLLNGPIDLTDALGDIINTSGISELRMGVNGLIRTIDLNGLGPATNASLQQSAGTFTTTSIDSFGTVEYYRSTTSGQVVTDRNYNNLVINGNDQTKTLTLTVNRTVNGNLTILPDAPFTITGNFTLNLKGNWIKNSTANFSSGNGATINFNGTTAQSISGTDSTYFRNLTINNSSGLTLDTLSNVLGLLTLTSGRINTTSENLLILDSTSTVSGGSTASFVNGPLRRHKKSVALSTLVFPVGKDTFYRRLDLTVTHNSNNLTEYTAEMFNTAPTARTLPGTLDGVSTIRYWNITKGTGAAVTAATVALNYGIDDGVTDPADLQVAKDDGAGTWVDLDGIASGSPIGSILSGNFTTFSDFVLANTTGGDNGLPVELTSFTASVDKNNVQLNWETKTEFQNYGFEIEKGILVKIGDVESENMQWNKIGFVEGNGNSNSPKVYSFADNKVKAGSYYYRLKQVDTDGNFEYSDFVEVTVEEIPENFTLEQNYPNPFNPSTTIKFGIIETAHTIVKLYDVTGSEVAELFNETAEGGKYYYINFDASNYASGIYYYTIISGPNKAVKKMMLLK
jgi:hypothetical protein